MLALYQLDALELLRKGVDAWGLSGCVWQPPCHRLRKSGHAVAAAYLSELLTKSKLLERRTPRAHLFLRPWLSLKDQLEFQLPER
ncbi:hypothetical protein [Mumia zhuanghuii]|uniref:Uncharacterized protein n=1 Tax=Mumia zhuanghuii TaxID=2585211 RepID=A0A5C4MFM0_9ACTN|nr:hypothetical protein [Mumia zhuanghuii]TNC33514.1 hypothetical protein FHE65_28915 [Mumia zhuanghuii]